MPGRVQAARAHAAPGQVRNRRQRVDEYIVALLEGDRRDAQQLSAVRGPGSEVGGLNTWLGDVHPVGCQRV